MKNTPTLAVLLLICALPCMAQEKIHKIKCITLGENYRPDGGSFVIQKSIGNIKSTLPAITQIKEVSFLEGFEGRSQDVSHTLCKRQGMEKSPDFENSYEICGASANLTNKDGRSMVISSKFNINEDACSTTKPDGFVHTIRSYLIEGFEEEERLKIEFKENKVGHIFMNDKKGQKVIKRIQCGSESNNTIQVPGANH